VILRVDPSRGTRNTCLLKQLEPLRAPARPAARFAQSSSFGIGLEIAANDSMVAIEPYG